MKLINYRYNSNIALSKHFKALEWNCKCGLKHDIKIAESLPELLELLMNKIDAVRGDIVSGYRCAKHDRNVGGNGSITHQGYACDIKFTDKSGKVIPSKKVVLALEDLGHNYGIGYRSGGNENYTHIDVLPRKWYGDEKKSMTGSCCTSFYDYFEISKNKYSVGTYFTLENMYVRNGAGTNYKIKKVKELSKDGKMNALYKRDNDLAIYKKGTKFTALKIINSNGVWALTPSGYVCIKGKSGKIYCQKK